MGDHLYFSSIHGGIDVPQLKTDGLHTFGHEFYEDIMLTIGKNR